METGKLLIFKRMDRKLYEIFVRIFNVGIGNIGINTNNTNKPRNTTNFIFDKSITIHNKFRIVIISTSLNKLYEIYLKTYCVIINFNMIKNSDEIFKQCIISMHLMNVKDKTIIKNKIISSLYYYSRSIQNKACKILLDYLNANFNCSNNFNSSTYNNHNTANTTNFTNSNNNSNKDIDFFIQKLF